MNPAFTDYSRMKNPFYQTLALSKKGRKLYLLYQAQLFVVRGGISCSAEGTVLTAAHHAWRQLWKCSCTSAAARAQGRPHTLLRPLCAIKLKASPQPTIQSSTSTEHVTASDIGMKKYREKCNYKTYWGLSIIQEEFRFWYLSS